MLYKGVVFGVYGFQFYLSSIKRGASSFLRSSICLFQFYLSSIKRYKIMEENTLVKGFNSTLVQLKVYVRIICSIGSIVSILP